MAPARFLSRRARATVWATRKVPVRLIGSTCAQSAGEMASGSANSRTPAELTRTSGCHPSASNRVSRSVTAAASVTSRDSARPPCWACAIAAAVSALRSAAITRAPPAGQHGHTGSPDAAAAAGDKGRAVGGNPVARACWCLSSPPAAVSSAGRHLTVPAPGCDYQPRAQSGKEGVLQVGPIRSRGLPRRSLGTVPHIAGVACCASNQ